MEIKTNELEFFLPIEILDVEDRSFRTNALMSILGVLNAAETYAKTTCHLVFKTHFAETLFFVLLPIGNGLCY